MDLAVVLTLEGPEIGIERPHQRLMWFLGRLKAQCTPEGIHGDDCQGQKIAFQTIFLLITVTNSD